MTKIVSTLADICSFSSERVAVADLNRDNYISTENILPDKQGIVRAAGLPTMQLTQAFYMGDVLVSKRLLS
jgi:type I restriction enzyme S subunit